MQYKKKGEIAVFLAMILSILLSFINLVIYGVRINLIKSEAILATDLAIRSCFAEYNKHLFEDFHLMLLDTSYNHEIPDEEALIDHYLIYVESNIDSDNITKVSVDNAILLSNEKINDHDEILISQIRNYLYHSHGYIEDDIFLYTYITDCIGSTQSSNHNCNATDEYEYLIYGYSSTYNHQLALEDYELYKEAFLNNHGYITFNLYEDFLKEKLFNTDEILLLRRLKDVINSRMHNYGNEFFDIDSCIYSAKIRCELSTDYGKSFTVDKFYQYEIYE